MRPIHYTQLGATLFTPAVHPFIQSVLRRKKYPRLKSFLIDLEDGLGDDYDNGVAALRDNIREYTKNDLLVFVRPKNRDSLEEVLSFVRERNIDGFILPKFSLRNAALYLELLENTPFYFMPSIEGDELFDSNLLRRLREILLPYRDRILSIRIGCEDMHARLCIQRKQTSVFERSVTASVVTEVLKTFKPYGLNVTGCVYPYFQDDEGLRRDVLRDLEEGLFGKTIIHPNQIDPVEECYKVSQSALNRARQVLTQRKAVFNYEGTMAEIATQTHYATFIVKRAAFYGVY